MALYHASTKPISRSAGRSSCAAAAYRAGVLLRDDRQGLTHDYRKRGDVIFAEIVVADGEPVDRAALWNAAEFAEKRKDARTAREWELALPVELSPTERQELALEFARDLAGRYGVAVDVAIHRAGRGDERNVHAHLLCTTRKFGRSESGAPLLGEKADIELSDTERKKRELKTKSAEEISDLRALWAQRTNAALERAGIEVRVDHRSYADQGVDREATFHLGPRAAQMERDGESSRIGDDNREIEVRNAERIALEQVSAAMEREVEQAGKELTRLQTIQDAHRNRQSQRDDHAIKVRWLTRRLQRQIRARDTVTAAERRPGVRHPEPPKWQQQRTRILLESYNREVAEALGRWVRVDRVEHGLHLHNQNIDLMDHGDRIVAGRGGTDREIEAMLLVVKAKGWTSPSLTGSTEFQEKLGRAFLDAGLDLADADLKQRILEKQQAERLAAEAEKTRQEDERREHIAQVRERRHARRQSWEIKERWSWRQQQRALEEDLDARFEREMAAAKAERDQEAERREHIAQVRERRHAARQSWEIKERWSWRQQQREIVLDENLNACLTRPFEQWAEQLPKHVPATPGFVVGYYLGNTAAGHVVAVTDHKNGGRRCVLVPPGQSRKLDQYPPPVGMVVSTSGPEKAPTLSRGAPGHLDGVMKGLPPLVRQEMARRMEQDQQRPTGRTGPEW